MNRTHIKLKLKRVGDHIHCTVFMEPEGKTLANCGKLIFRIGEWQLFGALLSLGYDNLSSMNKIKIGGDSTYSGLIEYYTPSAATITSLDQ